MKHLRIFNLLVVLLLLSAWVPLPQSFSSSNTVLAAYTGAFSGLKPANGTTAARFGVWPTFQWIFKPTNGVAPDNMALLVATDKAFTNLVVNKTDLPGTATSYLPTDQLLYNTILYWKVQAISTGGVASSATMTAYSFSEPVATLSDPVMDSLRPELRWSAPVQTNPVARKSYTVEVAENSTFTLNKKIFSNILDNRFDVPVSLKPNKPYWWHVQSIGTYGKSAFTTAGTFTTTVLVPPTLPVLYSPTNGFNLPNYQPLLKWTGPTGTGITYDLQIATNAIFSDAAIAYHKEGLTGLMYDFKAIGDSLNTGSYYWRVQAILTDTNGTVKSGWSKAFLFNTPSEVTLTVTDKLVGNPLQNVDVWATTNSACSQDARYLLAKDKTLADGTITLKGLTKGTRYLCAWPTTYALFKGTLAVLPGRAYKMSMPLVKPVIYIYLTWAARPSDLDVHLWLPSQYQDKDSAHIYPDGQRGYTTQDPWAKILNDASSPSLAKKTETIVIQNRYPGDYYFAVRNRTNEGWFPPNNPNAKPYVTVKYNGVWVNFADETNPGACVQISGKMAAPCRLDVPLPDTTTDGAKWWLVFGIKGETGEFVWTDPSGNPTNRLVKESDAASALPYDPAGGTAILP